MRKLAALKYFFCTLLKKCLGSIIVPNLIMHSNSGIPTIIFSKSAGGSASERKNIFLPISVSVKPSPKIHSYFEIMHPSIKINCVKTIVWQIIIKPRISMSSLNKIISVTSVTPIKCIRIIKIFIMN